MDLENGNGTHKTIHLKKKIIWKMTSFIQRKNEGLFVKCEQKELKRVGTTAGAAQIRTFYFCINLKDDNNSTLAFASTLLFFSFLPPFPSPASLPWLAFFFGLFLGQRVAVFRCIGSRYFVFLKKNGI